MRRIVISLLSAEERRASIKEEFRRVDLTYELWPAKDGFRLTDEEERTIDHAARDRLGVRRLDNASVGCLLSHLSVLRHLVESGDDMVAVFEDDARLHPNVPYVLEAIEGKAEKFDVIKLQRFHRSLSFHNVYHLARSHCLGRVKYHDPGAYGYVITRRAAAHLLERFPRPVHEIDWVLARYWENGLRNVFYLDPPVVFHDDMLPSHIASSRLAARVEHRLRRSRNPLAMTRRLAAGVNRQAQRWFQFRALRRQDLTLDPHGF